MFSYHRKINFFTIICLLFLLACSSEKQQKISVSNQVELELLGDSSGIFTDYIVGVANAEEALNASYDSLILAEDELVKLYRILNDSCAFEVEFVFESASLQSVEAVVHLSSMPQSESVFSTLHMHLLKKYGKGTSEGDYVAWETKNKHRETIEISLINESNENGFFVVSLSYFLNR